MSKKDENKNSETSVAELTATQETSLSTNQATISNEEAAKMLKDATRGEQDSGYLNFNPGDKKRVFFKGWKKIPSLTTQGELTDSVIFITDTGKEQINADVAIRSYFEKQTIGVTREIECKGLTKGPKGDYKTFDFFELKHS